MKQNSYTKKKTGRRKPVMEGALLKHFRRRHDLAKKKRAMAFRAAHPATLMVGWQEFSSWNIDGPNFKVFSLPGIIYTGLGVFGFWACFVFMPPVMEWMTALMGG